MIVKYSKKFPYAPYLNEDIGFELQVDEFNQWDKMEAQVMEALDKLKGFAEKFHKENYPHLYNDPHFPEPIPQGQQPIPTKDISEDGGNMSSEDIDKIVKAIEATEVKIEVERYKYLARTYTRIQEAYLNKLKQFV